jgi:hypothetical protein
MTCQKLSTRQISAAASLRQLLKAEYGSLEAARNRFTARIQENSQANSAALQSNIQGWENAITGARWARSGSATVLAVGAVVLTGGAATAALTGVSAANAAGAAVGLTAVSSGLTGVGKAQDSERHLTTEQAVGVAVVSGGFDFVTTVLTGGIAKGAKLAWAGKAVVAFFVKVPTKTATSIMLADMTRRKDEPPASLGVHAWSAVQDWAIDEAAGAAAKKILEISPVRNLLRKIVVAGANVVKENAADVKGLVIKKLVDKAADKTAQAGLKAGSSAVVRTAASVVSAGAPKDKLPEAVVRQPVHGGAALESAVLSAILSPLFSG